MERRLKSMLVGGLIVAAGLQMSIGQSRDQTLATVTPADYLRWRAEIGRAHV